MPADSAPQPRFGAVRGVVAGMGLLARGFGVWGTSPRLMLLGLLPGLITFVLTATAVVALALNLETIALAVTPFADGWEPGVATALRVLIGLAVLGAAVLLLAYTFAVVTLAIGQPFFEAISKAVDDGIGPVTEGPAVPLWRAVGRGVGEALGLLGFAILIGAGLALLGLIPVVGTVAAAVIGAVTGGWLLALELTAVPFERRGLRFADRRRMLGARRWVTLGFGVAVFVLFLIPLGAVVTMPAAVAGGTLLTRRILGEPTAATAVPAAD